MKVLVIGATGHHGASVIDGLLEAGNFVRAKDQYYYKQMANLGLSMKPLRRFKPLYDQSL
jgi:nucleoside-diphosphate-sugar epimerase